MNVQERKELRQMAPGFWMAAAAAAVAILFALEMLIVVRLYLPRTDGKLPAITYFFSNSLVRGVGLVAFWYGFHWMGASIVASEFQCGAAESFLAQPAARSELWTGKIRALISRGKWLFLGGALVGPIEFLTILDPRHWPDDLARCLLNVAQPLWLFAAAVGLSPWCAMMLRKAHFAVLLAFVIEMIFTLLAVLGGMPVVRRISLSASWASDTFWLTCFFTPVWLALMALAYRSAKQMFLKLEV